jgi:hypothetical protein
MAMWIPESNIGNGAYRYVELGRVARDHEAVFRQKDRKTGKPTMIHVDKIDEWRWKVGNRGLYTSVFQHHRPALGSAQLASLYLDLDAPGEPERVLEDVRRVVGFLLTRVPAEGLRIYFSGSKGFHVEVEAVVLGIVPEKKLADVFRRVVGRVARELELSTVDYHVYDGRRMWRLPDSRHQKSGLFKIHLLPEELEKSFDYLAELARFPRWFVPPPQVQDRSANQWWREQCYEAELRPFYYHGTNMHAVMASGSKLMDDKLQGLMTTSEGKRNRELNRTAFLFGQLRQAGRLLDPVTTEAEIHNAGLSLGLSEAEVRKTMRSGIEHGESSPYGNYRGGTLHGSRRY